MASHWGYIFVGVSLLENKGYIKFYTHIIYVYTMLQSAVTTVNCQLVLCNRRCDTTDSTTKHKYKL